MQPLPNKGMHPLFILAALSLKHFIRDKEIKRILSKTIQITH